MRVRRPSPSFKTRQVWSMRLTWSFILSAFGLGASACGPHAPPALIPTGESLPAWNYASAAAVVRNPPSRSCIAEPIRGSLVSLELLAWRVIDLGRGDRDEALWWGYFLTPNGPEWLLAMTFREPVGNDRLSWRFSRSPPWGAPCGRPIYHRSAAPLSNSDVVDFFRSSGAAEVTILPRNVDPGDWFHPTLMPGTSWVLRRVVVRATAWEAALGSPPPPEFRP